MVTSDVTSAFLPARLPDTKINLMASNVSCASNNDNTNPDPRIARKALTCKKMPVVEISALIRHSESTYTHTRIESLGNEERI